MNPAPPAPESESGFEPEITITESGNTKIEEYRAGGQIYMIRITPWKGVPYFLVDSNGDGILEHRSNDIEPRLLIPSWVLLRWK